MAFDREAIYQALQTRLSGALAPVKVSRRVKLWTEVPPSEQPIVFIDQGDQAGEGQYMKPTKWVLKASVYAYVHNTTADGPAPALNNLVKSIEEALSCVPGETGANGGPTTLGGLVTSCRVIGVTDSGGALADQGVAVIDLEVHTTS